MHISQNSLFCTWWRSLTWDHFVPVLELKKNHLVLHCDGSDFCFHLKFTLVIKKKKKQRKKENEFGTCKLGYSWPLPHIIHREDVSHHQQFCSKMLENWLLHMAIWCAIEFYCRDLQESQSNWRNSCSCRKTGIPVGIGLNKRNIQWF